MAERLLHALVTEWLRLRKDLLFMKLITSTTAAFASAVFFFSLAGPAMAQSDNAFIKDATEGGMFEVAAGKIAVQKTSNNDVRQFGQRMVDDHSKANDQLKALAAKDNFIIPSALNAKDQARLNRLSAMSGSVFDRAYMYDAVRDHESAVTAFRHETNNGKNADLKMWAAKTLPMIQDHLRQAKETQKDIGFISSNHISRK
jgi:putative membrane protein